MSTMRKSQITVYIIFGIALVILLLLILYAKNLAAQSASANAPSQQTSFQGDIEGFSSYVNSCLKIAFKDSLSKSGGNLATAKQDMKMNAGDCFDDSLFPGLSISIDLPPTINIIENDNEFQVTFQMHTIITQGSTTKDIQEYSFTYQKTEIQQSPAAKNTITTDGQQFAMPPLQNAQALPQFVVGEILVSYNETLNDPSYDAKLKNLSILSRKPVFNQDNQEPQDMSALDPKIRDALAGFTNDEIMTFNESNISFDDLRSELLNFSFVREVSRNKNSYPGFFRPPPRRMYRIVHLDENDSLYRYQWYLQNWGQFFGLLGADIKPVPAWNITEGDGSVTIAVIDEGIFPNSDISSSILYDKSYDFMDNSTDITPTSEDEYHGTHVSGIIASKIDNRYGIAGICPGCRIISMRVMDAESGVDSKTLLSAIARSISQGATIISMSLGGTYYSAYEENFIKRLSDAGIIFVAAAGNDGVDEKNYPAAYKGVIAVGATDNIDRIADFSNYGSWVQIYAPGDLILSSCSTDEYCFLSGTSMSTPIISASAGILKSINKSLASKDIVNILVESADNTQDGAKRVNLGNAARLAAGLPPLAASNQTYQYTEAKR